MQPEPDRLGAVPKRRHSIEVRVGQVAQLAQDAPVRLEEHLAHLVDPAIDLLRAAVAMLLAPARPALLGGRVIGGPIRRACVLHDPEEPVLGADHVQGHRPDRPLARRGLPIDIRIADARERAGQVAIGGVVLREDPLRLRRPRGTQRREPDGEIAQLVLGHEQRETQALLVVLVPDPGPVELRIG